MICPTHNRKNALCPYCNEHLHLTSEQLHEIITKLQKRIEDLECEVRQLRKDPLDYD